MSFPVKGAIVADEIRNIAGRKAGGKNPATSRKVDEVAQLVAGGKSISKACTEIGISRGAFRKYRQSAS